MSKYRWFNKGSFKAAEVKGVYVEKAESPDLGEFGLVYTAYFRSRLNGRPTSIESNTWIGLRNSIIQYKKAGAAFFGAVVTDDQIHMEEV